jgi:hypothetical protein
MDTMLSEDLGTETVERRDIRSVLEARDKRSDTALHLVGCPIGKRKSEHTERLPLGVVEQARDTTREHLCLS